METCSGGSVGLGAASSSASIASLDRFSARLAEASLALLLGSKGTLNDKQLVGSCTWALSLDMGTAGGERCATKCETKARIKRRRMQKPQKGSTARLLCALGLGFEQVMES